MAELDLDQPAYVIWVPADARGLSGAISGGEKRHFTHLRDALIFAVEELPEPDQLYAWIVFDTGRLPTSKEVMAVYEQCGLASRAR